MFGAVRELFAAAEERPPRRGRGRRVAALFLFEFVVVVLGVLVAQLLQDWFADRAEAKRAAEAVTELDRQARSFANGAEYRLRAHACEMRRLARLGALVRSGGQGSAADLAAPLMPMPTITPWADETRAAVSRHSPPGTLQRFDGLSLLARMISDRQRQLEDQWADFALLGPDWTATQESQRSPLALSVARAQGLLEAIDMNADYVIRYVPRFRPDPAVMRGLAGLDHPCAKVALMPATKPT